MSHSIGCIYLVRRLTLNSRPKIFLLYVHFFLVCSGKCGKTMLVDLNSHSTTKTSETKNIMSKKNTATASKHAADTSAPTATAPAHAETPAPAGMTAASPNIVTAPALTVRMENGRINLESMLPDEAAAFEDLKKRQQEFADSVTRRKQAAIAKLRTDLDTACISFGCVTADGKPDWQAFNTLVTSHLSNTLGMENPPADTKSGHLVPDAIKAKVEIDLRAGVANVIVADRYKVSLPWVSGFKKALGLVKSRAKKK